VDQQDQIQHSSIFDRYYSRRDTLDLLGSVAGCRILDAGCGIGKYAVDLSLAGADVVGIDHDEHALELARALAGTAVDFRKADLNKSLAFLGRCSFDAVLCSLALHYVEDWSTPLAEFKNLLKPGKQLVLSVHHPFTDYFDASSKNYFEVEPWDSGNQDVVFWRRPLGEILGNILDADFALSAIREPRPCPNRADFNATDLPRLLVIRAIRK